MGEDESCSSISLISIVGIALGVQSAQCGLIGTLRDRMGGCIPPQPDQAGNEPEQHDCGTTDEGQDQVDVKDKTSQQGASNSPEAHK